MSNRVEPIRSVKGTRDLLPPDTSLWQRVEAEAHRVFAAYHYGEIRTPILEETALFARGVGAETDIVTKEMYTFLDEPEDHLQVLRDMILDQGWKKDPQKERELDERAKESKVWRQISLRPEATASVVRAYIEHSLYNLGGIQKLYYIGPMFRRERPQKGRYRQFYQIGAEVLGSQNPMVDVEVIEMLAQFLERVGIHEYRLLINSVGCPNCRAAYLEVLRQALQDVKATMCVDCQRRADTNPLRVLDCKVEADQPIIEKLPKIIDHLDPECRRHFERVTSELQARGLVYEITPRLVRGLDYYTRTTFEITSGALGAQNAVVGGGRYDGLSEMLGGPPTPGIGFSIGQDRLILAVQAAAVLKPGNPLAAYVVWMGEPTLAPASRLVRELRAQGLSVEIDYDPAKIKKAMGVASKLQAHFAVIIGEGELANGRYQLKNLSTGLQEQVPPERIADYLKSSIEGRLYRLQQDLQERCQKALSNALRRTSGDGIFDSKGYVREIPHNYVRGISLSDFQEDFEKGAGDELRDKMKAPYSSSALVVNAFGRWRRDPSTLALRSETDFSFLEFEKQCPTGLQGFPPHLDLVAEGVHHIVAIESKCTEHLDPNRSQPDFSESYRTINDHRTQSPWFAHMLELMNIAKEPPQYKWLNAAQLIKHYLGLSHARSYEGRQITLLYLYWEPTNWHEIPEFHEHREEASRFGQKVFGDGQVKFEHMSYLDLWNTWRMSSTPDWLPDHVKALEERYSVAVPK